MRNLNTSIKQPKPSQYSELIHPRNSNRPPEVLKETCSSCKQAWLATIDSLESFVTTKERVKETLKSAERSTQLLSNQILDLIDQDEPEHNMFEQTSECFNLIELIQEVF